MSIAEGSRFGCGEAVVGSVVRWDVALSFDLAFVLGFRGREYFVVMRVEG